MFLLDDDILAEDQLKRLAAHKYNAAGVSVLEPYMQPFWRWLVEQIPLWWSPNALTLSGLLSVVATTFILVIYSPDACQDVPSWSVFLCAIGLFVYQTLDAIDGKQARRTGSSSPLGELFDHGCDAISIVFVVIGVCIAGQMGTNPHLLFFVCFSTIAIFYFAHWQTYCSGFLQFGYIDVAEAQFAMIALYVLTGFVGSSFWSLEIYPGVDMKLVPSIAAILVAVVICQGYFKAIFCQGGIGKNGSTMAGTSVLSPAIPLAVLLVEALMIDRYSTSDIFQHHPVLFVLVFGFSASKLCNKLVVAHMTVSELGFLDSCFIGPALLLIKQWMFPALISEYQCLWFCLLFAVTDYLQYSISMCYVICRYLNIRCFKITPSVTKGTNGTGSTEEDHKRQPANGQQRKTPAYVNGYSPRVTRSASRYH